MLEIDKIYQVDCLDGMSKIDDKSVSLILTDPPYEISRDSNYAKSAPIGKDTDRFRKCTKVCGTYYMNQKEYIIMLRKGGGKPINEFGTSDILSVPIPTNKRRDKEGLINQTEKPVKLMEILIRNSTNVGDVILDPFMGSGTTARACVNLERKYIGFEIDQRQVDFANNELKNMSRQLSLF